ncbi:MAG: DUF2933 domain-containing protein [Bacillus sp. (in: firmicutes)]
MAWIQTLLLLACPLMMLFCMKGMFSKNKNKGTESDHQQLSAAELQNLQIKMGELIEQNQILSKEIQSMKEKKNFTVALKELPKKNNKISM